MTSRLRRIVPVGLIAVATITPTASAADYLGRASVKATVAFARERAQVSSTTRGTFLGGFTSQNEPVVIDVARTWRTIPVMRTALDMRCASGTTLTLPDGWLRVPVETNGRVRAVFPIPRSSDGVIQGGTDSLSGTLNRRRKTFSGVWHLQVTFSGANGQSDSCDSGAVSFKAIL